MKYIIGNSFSAKSLRKSTNNNRFYVSRCFNSYFSYSDWGTIGFEQTLIFGVT